MPYRTILVLPGALAFSAAGLLGRLEISMVGFGALLLVQHTTGSYGLGGAVAATLGLSAAGISPFLARLVDRFGQRRVLRPAVVLHVAALVGLIAAAVAPLPLPLVFLAAGIAGVSEVSVGALVRARWAVLLGGTAQLQTAFALESVLDEVVFIIGPIVVALLATLVHPAAGLLVAAATALAGVLVLAAQQRTEPPLAVDAVRAARRRERSALGTRGMAVVVLVFLAAGGIFGSAEVAVVATTRAAGLPAAAGLVLALWATGSMLSGLVYGSIRWRGRLETRFTAFVLLLALLTAPMVFPMGVPLLAVVFLVAGVAIAPVITAGSSLVERLVRPGRLTEGLAWTETALGFTYAAAAAVDGAVIDAAGPTAGFLVPVGCAAAAAVVAVVGLPRLRAAATHGESAAAAG